MRASVTHAVLLSGLTLGVGGFAFAGNLTPPGGPVLPTMKTLDDVEPRTAIRTVDLPLTISRPGSYYLAEHITTAGGGITIESDEVTIDLNGFSLVGGTGIGISVPVAHKHITIKNGTVRGWGSGGIVATTTTNSRFQNLVVSNNGTTSNQHGLHASDGCIVTSCTMADNTGDGIRLSNDAMISDSAATGNGRVGIAIASGTISGCSARSNIGNGINASANAVIDGCVSTGSITGNGISAGVGSVVKNCSAISNAVDGIIAGFAEVRNCTCYDNNGDGIQAGFNSIIIGNNCSTNKGNLGVSAGIHVAGRRCRVEGNNVIQNDIGIRVVGIKNLVIKNSAARNTTNYSLAGDNAVGEVVDVTGAAGLLFTTGSPWANFVYEPVP